MAAEEEKSGAQAQDARAAFESARNGWQQILAQYTAAEQKASKELDLSSARMAATAAKAMLPEQIVITDAAS